MRINLTPANKEMFTSKHAELKSTHAKFWDDVAKLKNINDPHEEARQFFILLNGYRNKTSKIVNMLESLSHKDIRENMPILYKNLEYKKLVNVDAPKSFKAVETQDGYLKNKISELINVKKK
jgi:hypothetical protein